MLFDLNTKRGCDPIPSDLPVYEDEPLPPEPPESYQVEEQRKPAPFSSLDAEMAPFTLQASAQANGDCSSSACISERLLLAKKHARTRQRRLRIPTIIGAVVNVTVGFIFAFRASCVTGAIPGCHGENVYLRANVGFALGAAFAVSGSYIGMLGFLPTDTKALPRLGSFIVLPAFVALLVLYSFYLLTHITELRNGTCMKDKQAWPCWYIGAVAACQVCDIIPVLVAIGKVSYSVLKVPSHILLATIWCCMGWVYMVPALTAIPRLVLQLAVGGSHSAFLDRGAQFSFGLAGFVIIFCVDFRSRVQSWFMSRGEAAVTAAGVAELLVGKDIQEVLNAARDSFLSVQADQILKEHVEHNKPNPDLQAFTRKSRLGFVDAFVSHSWHDNSDLKWQAFQDLRNNFKERHMKEPTVWFDKFSINQNSIDASLACLPVYLSGCRHLWILCGKTYLKRLWCLIEVYIFLEMGGDPSNLHVKILQEKEDETSALSLQDELRNFNPRDATCCSDEDTLRLQAVIGTFGHHRICQLVNDVFLLYGRLD